MKKHKETKGEEEESLDEEDKRYEFEAANDELSESERDRLKEDDEDKDTDDDEDESKQEEEKDEAEEKVLQGKEGLLSRKLREAKQALEDVEDDSNEGFDNETKSSYYDEKGQDDAPESEDEADEELPEEEDDKMKGKDKKFHPQPLPSLGDDVMEEDGDEISLPEEDSADKEKEEEEELEDDINDEEEGDEEEDKEAKKKKKL